MTDIDLPTDPTAPLEFAQIEPGTPLHVSLRDTGNPEGPGSQIWRRHLEHEVTEIRYIDEVTGEFVEVRHHDDNPDELIVFAEPFNVGIKTPLIDTWSAASGPGESLED